MTQAGSRPPGHPARALSSAVTQLHATGDPVFARYLPLALLVGVPHALHAQSDASIQKAVASITTEDVAHRIGVLADDSMRGRSTPSPELETAAQYIAGEFQRLGLAPAGDDGTYLQRYPLEIWGVDTENPVLAIADGPSFTLGENAARFMGSSRGAGQEIAGPVAVVWGTAAKPADVASLELAGAVVLYVPRLTEGRMTRASWITLTGLSTRAAALVILSDMPEEAWARTLAGERDGQPTPAGSSQAGAVGGAPMISIQVASIADALTARGIDIASIMNDATDAVQLRAVDGMRATVKLDRMKLPDTSAPNVVGIIEGSDPDLKNEFIIFSAHMDHAGTTDGPPFCSPAADEPEDTICNGADDNASGTVAVVELAEAFAALQPRPKRSIVFLTVSGEERGLWGSGYYAEHPTVPMEQVVANINVDMVGRNWPDTIVVIGKEHSDLGTTLNRVNAEHPELNMTAIDDIWPEENFYNRSDHIHFARRGVPILFFFNGTHDDYHGANDEPDRIDAEKESRIVKLLLYLGIDIANGAERPKWNPESYEKVVS